MNTERRITPLPTTMEARAEGQGGLLRGLAAVFYDEKNPGTEYKLWEGAVERIRPGAFDKALAEGRDVPALFNHNPELILGRTGAKTVTLRKTPQGLEYEIDLAPTERSRDLLEHVKRGDITGSSFGFIPRAVTWDRAAKVEVRWIDDVELIDVGPVTFPAYEGTSVGARALGDITEVLREHDLEGILEEVRQPEKPGSMVVQSLIFDKKTFDEAKARKWAEDHKFHASKVDETEDSFRLRQRDPGEFEPNTFRTVSLTKGVQAVMGKLKRSADPHGKLFRARQVEMAERIFHLKD